MSSKSPRPCPVCGGLERRNIFRQRFLEGPLGDGYDVVVCRQCGAGFADGIASQADLDRHYSEESKYTYDHRDGSESVWDRGRFDVTLGQVEPHLRGRDARILDIGCATGGLVAAFRSRGFTKAVGADPSPECAVAARRLHGVEVRVATLEQMRGLEERVDMVTLLGVLEHIREARRAVETAARLLAPGGLVYCAVPDVGGFAACANAPYQQFSTEHVNYFSIHSLERLFACAGLAPVRSWRWTTEWSAGVTEPIASALFRAAPCGEPMFDPVTEDALQRYVTVSAEAEGRLASVAEALRVSREAIVIWGAGTLARRILAVTRLSEANILAFVDSSRHLQGHRLAGRPIVAWEEVSGRKATVVICSVAFEKEIAEAIRGRSGYAGRILSITGREIS